MGLGLGFNAGPVRVSASLRGGGAAAGEALEALPFIVTIAVGYQVIGLIVSMVLDPLFWFIMGLGCAPAVALLVFHAVALDKAAVGSRWSARDGMFVLLALPAAGYELLFFAWAFDAFKWEVSIGGKWMPQLAYFAVLLAYMILLTIWIWFTVGALGRSLSREDHQRHRDIARVKRRQAREDRRLMRKNRVIVKRHGVKNATVLRLVLEDYRVMEDYKDLVLKHGLTDASQVRAHLRKQALEKIHTRQLEIERAQQAQRAEDGQQRADAEARRKLRVLTVKMQQFRLVVQRCLNPEQGVEISEEELRAAFDSIRRSLNGYQELFPIGVAKYEKIISKLSATVAEKTGYENL